MKLAIFDIDGTLTDTHGVHTPCIYRVLAEKFDISRFDIDWTDLKHVTDSHVWLHIFGETQGRSPSEEEQATYRAGLAEALVDRRAELPDRFGEIAGARAAFDRLRNDSDWAVVLASGGWGDLSQMKLSWAGFEIDGTPGAFGEDGISREAIIRTAVKRVKEAAGVDEFEKTVSIGDGTWDVVTARIMELDFVGIASAGNEEQLAKAGADTVLPDYQDLDRFLEALDRATAPPPK